MSVPPTTAKRGRRLALIAGFVIFASAAAAYAWPRLRTPDPIRIGILHSLSGHMAASEGPVHDAALLAVDEINAAGGLLGRPIEPIVADGRSDWRVFVDEARRLIVDERVSAVFGGWTSDSRRMMRPVFEEHDHLLFYPVQYEGLEASPNIVYTGTAPNQQIIPAVKWSFDTLGKRFFLAGSDYVFPRVAHAIVRDHLRALGGEVVGEEYVLLGATDVEHIIRRIVETDPDVIFNTINGDTNLAFFRALRAAGITPDRHPTISTSITENELLLMRHLGVAGDYLAASYFQTVGGEANRKFVERFRNRYGEHRVLGDAMEAAYIGVHLWAQAVAEAETDDVEAVRETVKRQSLSAPQGVVYVDPENRHTWKTVRIGRIGAGGGIEEVWTSGRPVRPVPYPILRSTTTWLAFLEDLHRQWGGRWDNPGVTVDPEAAGSP